MPRGDGLSGTANLPALCSNLGSLVRKACSWLRGLDSNQDNQLQRLACYQLHYPGAEGNRAAANPSRIAGFFAATKKESGPSKVCATGE